ncbi:hypothetical protein PM082_019632 [Marasmius tenuissimus]|nr:hypothetical protein PM082_019632 [Marasmius tenuissimus]
MPNRYDPRTMEIPERENATMIPFEFDSETARVTVHLVRLGLQSSLRPLESPPAEIIYLIYFLESKAAMGLIHAFVATRWEAHPREWLGTSVPDALGRH